MEDTCVKVLTLKTDRTIHHDADMLEEGPLLESDQNMYDVCAIASVALANLEPDAYKIQVRLLQKNMLGNMIFYTWLLTCLNLNLIFGWLSNDRHGGQEGGNGWHSGELVRG